MRRKILLAIAHKFFHPTDFQRAMGYEAWVRIPLIHWEMWITKTGDFYWR